MALFYDSIVRIAYSAKQSCQSFLGGLALISLKALPSSLVFPVYR